MNTKLEIDKFILLSEVLTGKKDLNKKNAKVYLDRLELQIPAGIQKLFAEMDKIISAAPEPNWEFEFKRKLIENETKFVETDKVIDNNSFSAICQQILRIWYTSQFIVTDDKTDIRTREQYNAGLLWKIIHTEAPGADKKKKYGFWKENPTK
jgi:hypothetical protein